MFQLCAIRETLTSIRLSLIAMVLCVQLILPPAHVIAQTFSELPEPGEMVSQTAEFTPPLMMGMSIDPQHPFQFEFILDTGDDYLIGEELAAESKKLINYFLTTMTIPEDALWVNLSPYEKNRIIADDLATTEMGRDMLAQDYLLKQLMASMMYPEEDTGREFWQRVYAKAGAKNIPADLFNKIWIVPERADVHVNGTTVFVVDCHLNVMLEQDYLALQHHQAERKSNSDDLSLSSDQEQIIREVLIPEIEREVNQGKNFAQLRQIFYSMILATWYKKNLKSSFLTRAYADQNKMPGIDTQDPQLKQEIYQRYLDAFEKGVFNYIREDLDPDTQNVIPRQYFSGGVQGVDSAMIHETSTRPNFGNNRELMRIKALIQPKADRAQLSNIRPYDQPGVLSDGLENADFDKTLQLLWRKREQEGVFQVPYDHVESRRAGGYLYLFSEKMSAASNFDVPKVWTPRREGDFDLARSNAIPQRLFEAEYLDKPVSFHINYVPRTLFHFLVLPERDLVLPQKIRLRDVQIGMEIISQASNQDLILVYNSLGAGASVNHLHLQGMFVKGDGFPSKGNSPRLLYDRDGLTITQLDHPATVYQFEGLNRDRLALVVHALAYHLGKHEDIPFGILMKEDKIYVIPINREKSREYDHILRVSATDIFGIPDFQSRLDFENLTATELDKIFESTALNSETVDGLNRLLSDNPSNFLSDQAMYSDSDEDYRFSWKANDLLNLLKEERKKRNLPGLTRDEIAAFILMADLAKDLHRGQYRLSGEPYFIHPLDVAERLIRLFGIVDPAIIQIALLHDAREDQEHNYTEMIDNISDKVRLGIRILSNLKGPKYENLQDPAGEYLRRLRDPKKAYPPFPKSDWYNDEFIRSVQLIKIADRLSNLADFTKIFDNLKELTVRERNFPNKIMQKTINEFIPELILKSQYLSNTDKFIFFREAIEILYRYIAHQDDEGYAQYSEIIDSALDALPKFVKYSRSFRSIDADSAILSPQEAKDFYRGFLERRTGQAWSEISILQMTAINYFGDMEYFHTLLNAVNDENVLLLLSILGRLKNDAFIANEELEFYGPDAVEIAKHYNGQPIDINGPYWKIVGPNPQEIFRKEVWPRIRDGLLKDVWIPVDDWEPMIVHELSRVDHPSIPTVNVINDRYHIKGIRGPRLTEWSQTSEAINMSDKDFVNQILTWVIQLTDAMQILKGRGVIHGDIKAANIIIDQSTNAPVLIDFGDVMNFNDLGNFPHLIYEALMAKTLGQFKREAGRPGSASSEQLEKRIIQTYEKHLIALTEQKFESFTELKAALVDYQAEISDRAMLSIGHVRTISGENIQLDRAAEIITNLIVKRYSTLDSKKLRKLMSPAGNTANAISGIDENGELYLQFNGVGRSDFGYLFHVRQIRLNHIYLDAVMFKYGQGYLNESDLDFDNPAVARTLENLRLVAQDYINTAMPNIGRQILSPNFKPGRLIGYATNQDGRKVLFDSLSRGELDRGGMHTSGLFIRGIQKMVRIIYNYPALDIQFNAAEYHDFAMTAPGGIDLSPANLDLTETGDSLDFEMQPFDYYLSPDDIQGFHPVIINIIPITNFPLLFGGQEQLIEDGPLLSLRKI